MTAPNIARLSSVVGKTEAGSLGITTAVILSNAASSNKVLKVNSIIVANRDGLNASDATIAYNPSATGIGTNVFISYTITVPGDATLVALGKDTPIYLEEDKSITGQASVANGLHYIISYEEIS